MALSHGPAMLRPVVQKSRIASTNTAPEQARIARMSGRGGRWASATLAAPFVVSVPFRISSANFFVALLAEEALLPPDCFKAGCVFSLLATAIVNLINGDQCVDRRRGTTTSFHTIDHGDSACIG
jgi:hypothetical protein